MAAGHGVVTRREPIAPVRAGGSAQLPFVAVGSARLPRSFAGNQASPLMVELVFDPAGSILDVATSIPLPGYTALLKRLLIGHGLAEIERLVQDLCLRYRGPLLRPTIAALANAVANSRDRRQLEG